MPREGHLSVVTHILGLLAIALLVGILAGCTPTKVVKPLNVAAEYPSKFVCQKGVEGGRPALPPELALPEDFEDVANYKEWHTQFMERVRQREGIVASYILALEAVNFTCWDNMQWQRDFYKNLAP